MNRDCGRRICQSVPWLYLRVPLERVHCRPRRQIVQRLKPIDSALGGCLTSWCIIPGCLLCQFAIGATLSSQLWGALLRPQDSYGNSQRLSDYLRHCHFDCPNHILLSTSSLNQDNTNNTSTAVTNLALKLFSMSFCNIRGPSSNINPVHHHLQSINPCALFLTETKIKPLDPSNSTVLSPHLKCQGYELLQWKYCLQLLPGRPRGPTSLLPPAKFTMSPIKFSTREVRQTLLQLDTSKSKGPDGIPAIVVKTCAPELALFLTNYSRFHTLLAHFPPRGNKPTSFLSQKRRQV